MSPLSCLFVFVLCCVRCASPPRCTRWHPPLLFAQCLPRVCWCPTAQSNHRPYCIGRRLPSRPTVLGGGWLSALVCRKVGFHISITKQNHNNHNIPNKSHQIYPIGWCFGTRRITPRIVTNHTPAIHPWTGSSTFYSGWQIWFLTNVD